MSQKTSAPRCCYATQLGDCSGSLNREHFVSKHLLKEFEEAGKIQVTGYLHGNDAGQFVMSVESMSAKVLCESHNSRLSKVDTEGGRFLSAFFAAHNGLLAETVTTDQTYEFDGPIIERWMLKAACGLLASGQAGVGTERIERTSPPLEFLKVLFGLETFPSDWGLYTRPTTPVGFSDKKNLGLGLYLPLQPNGRRHVCGVKLEHYGFTTIFALKTPQQAFERTDLDGAFHHPEFFKVVCSPPGRTVTIRVKWPEPPVGSGFVIDLHKGSPPV
jgi:hypothetical protein